MKSLACCLFLALVIVARCDNDDEDRPDKYMVTDEAWFDVEIKDMDGPGEDFKGRFVIALFGKTVPYTVMNFRTITEGKFKHLGKKLHYKGTPVHRIVQDFIIQMGDITVGDGSGGRSIFATKFNDENFVLSHRGAGWVAMANHGPDTNGSQFFILMTKARWLDGKHVVFGKVIRGYDVVKTVGEVKASTRTAAPSKKIKIVDCGLNKLDQPYVLKEADLDSVEDL